MYFLVLSLEIGAKSVRALALARSCIDRGENGLWFLCKTKVLLAYLVWRVAVDPDAFPIFDST